MWFLLFCHGVTSGRLRGYTLFDFWLHTISDTPQHGFLLERAHNVYSFAHLTFQEYFTARYVVENEVRGTLPHLVEHYNDPSYREVILLTAAQLPDATRFSHLFLSRLAAESQRRPVVAALLYHTAFQASVTSGREVTGAAARSLNIYLARARARTFALDTNLTRAFIVRTHRNRNFDLDLELDLARTLARDPNLDRILELARDLDFHLGYNRPDFYDRELPHTVAFAHSQYHTLARDIALTNGWLIVESSSVSIDLDSSFQVYDWLVVAHKLAGAAAIQSGRIGDVQVQQRLANLAERLIAPEDKLDRRTLEGFSGELRVIMEEDCDMKFPNLDDEDWNELTRFLDGNRLLLECLDQAVVADRQAIKDRLLLLPPKE